MWWLQRLRLILFPSIRRAREQSLEQELRSHLQFAADEAGKDNVTPEEARLVANRDLGNTTLVKENARSEWLFSGWERFAQDIRYACRTLPHTPLFTSVTILSLALGIGAATAIFSLVEGVLLKPLAYRDPGRLVYIQEIVPVLSHLYPAMPVNIQHFRYWHDHTRAFESIVALRADQPTFTGAGEPFRIDGIETTADLFKVLGVDMALGRGFLPGDDLPGKNHIAVITDSLWRQRFASSPGAVGKSIVLDGVPTTIVGILPRNFTFPKGTDLGPLAGLGKRTEIIRPLQTTIEGWDGDYDYICIGRLRSGTAPAQCLAELTGLTKQFINAYQVDSHPRPLFQPLQDLIAGPVRTSLLVLLTAVMALLLIVCVNLANLALARSSVRAREFSIRAALGAGRSRLVQQVITEAALLSLCGGVSGVALAALSVRLFIASSTVHLPRLDEVAMDGRVLLFAIVITVGCAVLFGVIPAFRMGRSDPQESLKIGTHTTSSNKQTLRLRETLISLEVAFSTFLLFVAGLLISSVFHLLHVDKGFTEDRAFAVDLSLPDIQYPDIPSRNRFFTRTLDTVRTLPGVKSAATIMGLPLTGETHVNGIELEGSENNWISAAKTNSILINVRFISSDYFATLGIPLLQGRALDAHDGDRRVAVVSERFAARVWHGQNPLGKRFKTGSRVGQVQVIGVSKDVYNGRLDQAPTLIAYVPYSLRGPNYSSLVVRTAGNPAALMQPIRQAIRSIDSRLPVPPFVTMGGLVNESLATRRFQMRISSLFGLGALCLALIGIYGVVAYNVSARRTEMGVRLALGAKQSELIRFMMWRGLRPALVGLVVGLAASASCGWLVRSLLFGVHATDPLTLTAVAALLLLAGSLACLLPASAIAKMDPSTALRYE